jgi:hypothetical protein
LSGGLPETNGRGAYLIIWMIFSTAKIREQKCRRAGPHIMLKANPVLSLFRGYMKDGEREKIISKNRVDGLGCFTGALLSTGD